ncbi:MAG: Crp/Fnr family transcriptional regulator [Ideonella sp. MAG2]|nr:MAG: Crp/Fnr family transcriptional regulator [Ideonella sp. MAG2]
MASTPSLPELHTLLSEGAWFAELPTAVQTLLLQHGQCQSLDAGQRLFLRGDPCDGLYAVLSGAMLITDSSPEGRDSTLALLAPPTWFGEISIIDNGPRTHDAHAQVASTLWWVSRSQIDDLLAAQPELWRHLARLVTTKMRLLFWRLSNLAAQPAQTRLIHELLRLAQGYGLAQTPAGPRLLPIKLDQLAGLAATSRQTASEVLGHLQRQGWVRRQAQGLVVVDEDALRQQLHTP